ncbi:MAG TPA: hypothetical protein VGM76_14350 [Lacipirellulaceae bacterium]
MRLFTATALIAALLISAAASSRCLAADPAALLDVSKGQIPDDTGNGDGRTKMSITKSDELGGDALQVQFSAGDSFGDRAARVKNWKPFSHLSFDVFNPAAENVLIIFNVNHRETKAFATRVSREITLTPGKNNVRMKLDELTNSNGSKPELGEVVRWFIGVEEEKKPTLLFSSIVLDGGEGPKLAAPASQASGGGNTAGGNTSGGAGAPTTFKVTGTIGNQSVDLTVTPNSGPGAEALNRSALPATVYTVEATSVDPARANRLRATKMPAINNAISFDTPEADAVMAAVEMFPANSPWYLDVSKFPLHPNSQALVASTGADKVLRVNYDMAYVIVPPTQQPTAMKLTELASESDQGPFPIPANLPIEGWPVEFKSSGVSLDAVQQNAMNDQDSDRHAIVLDPVNGRLHEFFKIKRVGAAWEAEQASTFNLKSNKLRPDSWTSADAAGLAILPAVVRYDELQRGEIEHALRVTIRTSRKAYVYPATHRAGHTDDENVMRMGERLRLRASFDTSQFTPAAQTILKALKKHGMFVADNGNEWAISIAPDPRIPNLADELRKVKGGDFEVVEFPKGYTPPTN